jgi:DNA-binding HxlR family transcriptional regulator
VPTARSYHDQCGIARALDVVGERWALLVVRELLLGPRRFTELRQALANTSANVITDRLRELESRGVIQRRKLALPSGSWVYELTARGRQLEPILLALGGWGLEVPYPPTPNVLTPTSVLIHLRGCSRPDPGVRGVVRIIFDDQVWTARTKGGHLTIEIGDIAEADATIATNPLTFNALIGDVDALQTEIDAGRVTVDGDLEVLRQLLQDVEISGATPEKTNGRAHL